MNRIVGTARPVRERDPSTYFCQRCGIERPERWPKKAGRLCRDCVSVLALEDAS